MGEATVGPRMSAQSLLSLKEYLTLSEVARCLRTQFEEEVTPADVLQIGLQGRLKLSFNFVNPSPAVLGKVASFDGREAVIFPMWSG